MKIVSEWDGSIMLDVRDNSGASGADVAQLAPVAAVGAETCRATILQGGVCILAYSGASAPPPTAATMRDGSGQAAWRGVCWRGPKGDWCGLALLQRLPFGEILVGDAPLDETRSWRCPAPTSVDVDPLVLAAFAIETAADGATLLAFCMTHLVGADGETPQAHRAFTNAFLSAAATPDGFVEIVAAPEGRGAFLQGWSMALAAGTANFAIAGDDIAFTGVAVAHFGRDDILPPGAGFCAYSKDPAAIADIRAVFFETGDRLRRLDVSRDGPVRLADDAAVEHIRSFAPRLSGPEATLRAFRRVCRPRFAGVDTLNQTTLPVAAALDAVLRAPDGGLLVVGWLLDPTHIVERAILRGAEGTHAPLHGDWIALPRPDLVAGFGRDPRFANLLGEKEAMYGFVCHAPAQEQNEARTSTIAPDSEDLYFELVLSNESCLFLPVVATRIEAADHRLDVLCGLGPDNPDLDVIVRQHLAPFFRGIRPSAATTARRANPPTPLGADPGENRGGDSGANSGYCASRRPVSAVMPFERLADLQPIFSALMGKPEAEMLDLTLVASRRTASETLEMVRQAFDFYRLSGRLVVVGENRNAAQRLDAGVAASSAPHILAWNPCVLPKDEGWLEKMLEQAGRTVGLISPTLLYEDGSVYFGGGAAGRSGSCRASRFIGYGEHWLHDGPATPTSVGAAEMLLIPRDLLAKVGGFVGRLFSDAYVHVDLSARVTEAGAQSWWMPGVALWMLDDKPEPAASDGAALLRRVDAALATTLASSLAHSLTPSLTVGNLVSEGVPS